MTIERRATGFFTLDEVPSSEQLYMLSTGTALGPFISILEQGDVWQKFEHVHLVHGVRLNEDLSYQQRIAALQKQNPNLHYSPVVSRESASVGFNGRITDVIKDHRLFEVTGKHVNPDTPQFMICGNPEMVKDTTAILLELGFSRNRRREPGQITVEQYW